MRGLLTSALAIAFALVIVSATHASPRKPYVELKRFSADGKNVDFSARICYRRGPKAFGLVTETLSVGGVVQGTLSTSDPLGWDLTKPEPFRCEAYAQSWTLDPSLQGQGEYKVVIRIRDGTGLSNAVSFTRHP
jgi:hypothetical protein